jgi:hypothetical protein
MPLLPELSAYTWLGYKGFAPTELIRPACLIMSEESPEVFQQPVRPFFCLSCRIAICDGRNSCKWSQTRMSVIPPDNKRSYLCYVVRLFRDSPRSVAHQDS